LTENLKKIIYGKKSLAEGDILFVSENDFQSPPFSDESSYLAIQTIKKIQNSLLDLTPITELFSNEKYSLWWLIYPQIFYHLETKINFVTNFSKFLDKSLPQRVIILDDFNEIDLIKQICIKKKISFKFSQLAYFKFKMKKNFLKFRRKYGTHLIFNKKGKERKKLFFSKVVTIPSLENKILFVAGPGYRRKIFDHTTGKIKSGEYIIQDIIKLIEDKKSIIGIDLWSNIQENNDSLKERLSSNVFWIPIEALVEVKNKNQKNFLNKYNHIISSDKFRLLLKFEGIFLWKSLEGTFEKLKYSPYIPYWISLIDSLNILFSNQKPQAIFLPYETGPTALAFIIASRKNNVKTIGVQHGFIHKFHKSYSHENFATDENLFGFPLPNKILLYGNITKKLLEEKDYPTKILIPFGNPTFFNLETIKKALIQTDVNRKYKIKKNKKIILYTTSGFQELNKKTVKYDFDTQVWRYLLKNFGNNEEYYLILKPHPLEDLSTYENVLHEKEFSNAQVIQGNLIELIYISSIVVSIFSTTIFDSMCFKKPVIQVKFEGASYSLPFNDSNIGVQSSLHSLSNKIIEILQNNSLQNTIVENNSRFIKEFYGIPEKNMESKLNYLIKDES